MVEWDYKKTEGGVPHMLAPKRCCLGDSKVYCDVRKRWLLAWNQNRHITYYIFHIPYTNSEISIGLLYIRPLIVWWHGLNHCATLVRNLAISILVRSSVSLLTFHTLTILAPLWFPNFERCRFHNLFISTLSLWLVLHGRSCWATSKILCSSLRHL